MQKIVPQAILVAGVGGALAMAGVFGAGDAPGGDVTRQQVCQRYARAQFRDAAAGEVSGTTLKFSYDDRDGLCVVQVGSGDAAPARESTVRIGPVRG